MLRAIVANTAISQEKSSAELMVSNDRQNVVASLLREAGIEHMEYVKHGCDLRSAIGATTGESEADLLVIMHDASIDLDLIYFLMRSQGTTVLLHPRPRDSASASLREEDRIVGFSDDTHFPQAFYGAAVLRGDAAKTFQELSRAHQADLATCLRLVVSQEKGVEFVAWPLSPDHHRRGGGSYASSNVVTRFRKEARNHGRRKLRDEIRFLRELPEPLATLYPSVSNSGETTECVFMEQELLHLVTLRQFLFTRPTSAEAAFRRIETVVESLQRLAYLPYRAACPDDYLEQYHFQRLWHRLRHTLDRAPIFGPFLTASRLWINGRYYYNVPQLLHQFERSDEARRIAKPDFVSPYVHGDLHFENIMVDPESEHFRLVDPRGYDYCDVYYDLGKISHSVNGKYDFLHENRFDLRWLDRGGEVEAELVIPASPLLALYDELDGKARAFYPALTGDPLAEERTLFAEAMHFCTMMPFHLMGDGRENRSIAIYLTGVILFNQVFSRFGITPNDNGNRIASDLWAQQNWRNVG